MIAAQYELLTKRDLAAINGLVFGLRFGTVGKNTVPNLVNDQIACVLSGSPDYAQARI
ncbi:hypothetical protein [Xylella fastidiosa]|uniref:hypothetical protein n=1 Tax=Xylella fastidiosa TaxID=2371 RepID=UPI0002FB7651|nr:hypothetical protein [Xylella fastidiosa]